MGHALPNTMEDSMAGPYKAVLLEPGLAVVNKEGGGTYILIQSSRTVDWWQYLYQWRGDITSFAVGYCKPETIADFAAGVLTHNDGHITHALIQMYADSPNDQTLMSNHDLLVLAAIGRLASGFGTGQ